MSKPDRCTACGHDHVNEKWAWCSCPLHSQTKGTKAWRTRVEEGRPLHGLGPSEFFPGNVAHLVSPLVGELRLMERDGEALKPEKMAYYIDRLMLVLELAREQEEPE